MADARLRPLWSGTLSFGLVTVPVDLFPALQTGGRTTVRMLAPDGTPVERRWVCSREDREVPDREIVRGYEIEPGEHVVVTEDELEQLAPARSRDIDLERFVGVDELDPMLFQRAYYLTPAGDSTKPYRLLAGTMEDASMAGIARFVMRGVQYLVAIVSRDGILRAETLRTSDERRDPQDVGLADGSAPGGAVRRMKKVIRQLEADDIDRSELDDRYRRRLDEVARRQAEKGKAVEVEEERTGETVDLVAVLRRSLTGGPSSESGRRRGPGGAERSAFERQSKRELYERAKRLDIPGRSRMNKQQLARAVRDRMAGE